MIDEFEILAPYEDLIARRLQRLFQTEEFRCRRKVKRTTTAIPHNADLVWSITKQLARDCKLTGRTKRVVCCNLSSRHRISVYYQLETNRRLDLSTNPQIVVQRKHDNCRVACVAPLRPASILYQPVCDWLDQLVLRIYRQQSTKNE